MKNSKSKTTRAIPTKSQSMENSKSKTTRAIPTKSPTKLLCI